MSRKAHPGCFPVCWFWSLCWKLRLKYSKLTWEMVFQYFFWKNLKLFKNPPKVTELPIHFPIVWGIKKIYVSEFPHPKVPWWSWCFLGFFSFGGQPIWGNFRENRRLSRSSSPVVPVPPLPPFTVSGRSQDLSAWVVLKKFWPSYPPWKQQFAPWTWTVGIGISLWASCKFFSGMYLRKLLKELIFVGGLIWSLKSITEILPV